MNANSLPRDSKAKRDTSRVVISKKRSLLSAMYVRKKGDNKYSFSEEEISDLFEGIMGLKLIEIPEAKHPQSFKWTDDLLYFLYHRLVSHQIINYFVLKNKIKRLIADGDVELTKSH